MLIFSFFHSISDHVKPSASPMRIAVTPLPRSRAPVPKVLCRSEQTLPPSCSRMSGSSWKVATLTSRGVVVSGKFFLREKKESRYAETISDRESTCRTAVSPVLQRGKSHCPDDLADGTHRWDAAGRCGSTG